MRLFPVPENREDARPLTQARKVKDQPADNPWAQRKSEFIAPPKTDRTEFEPTRRRQSFGGQ